MKQIYLLLLATATITAAAGPRIYSQQWRLRQSMSTVALAESYYVRVRTELRERNRLDKWTKLGLTVNLDIAADGRLIELVCVYKNNNCLKLKRIPMLPRPPQKLLDPDGVMRLELDL